MLIQNVFVFFIYVFSSLTQPPPHSSFSRLSVSLLSFLFAMLAGPNLPADISIPWHSANWHRCRETEREGERMIERKKISEEQREEGMRVKIEKKKVQGAESQSMEVKRE